MGSKRATTAWSSSSRRFYEGAMAQGASGPMWPTQIWDKLAAFANYGFPESHAMSLRATWSTRRRG